MANWVVALGSPLIHFHLGVSGLDQEWTIGLVKHKASSCRTLAHMFAYVMSGYPPGWTPIEHFVPTKSAAQAAAKRLSSIKTLKTFTINHEVELSYLCNGARRHARETVFQHETRFKRSRKRGVNKVRMEEPKLRYSDDPEGYQAVLDEIDSHKCSLVSQQLIKESPLAAREEEEAGKPASQG